jgi:hypothetical protein
VSSNEQEDGNVGVLLYSGVTVRRYGNGDRVVYSSGGEEQFDPVYEKYKNLHDNTFLVRCTATLSRVVRSYTEDDVYLLCNLAPTSIYSWYSTKFS